MHIPDGLIITNEPLSIVGAIGMWIISFIFLYWSWKKAKITYSKSITALLGISSAFIFAAQMINFPVIFGTSGHLVGGTFLAILLGPYAAILGMTIVLIMQAVIFADGGILAFSPSCSLLPLGPFPIHQFFNFSVLPVLSQQSLLDIHAVPMEEDAYSPTAENENEPWKTPAGEIPDDD